MKLHNVGSRYQTETYLIVESKVNNYETSSLFTSALSPKASCSLVYVSYLFSFNKIPTLLLFISTLLCIGILFKQSPINIDSMIYILEDNMKAQIFFHRLGFQQCFGSGSDRSDQNYRRNLHFRGRRHFLNC